MARDPHYPVPDSAVTAGPVAAAPTVEVMVLDVPRAAVRDIEHELATLATLPSIELVDAAGMTWELRDRSAGGSSDRDEDLDGRDDLFAGAFFGADENGGSGVRAEIAEAVGRLPASRAAVVVLYRNRWRARLDGLFRSNGVQILVERSVSATEASDLSNAPAAATSAQPAAAEA